MYTVQDRYKRVNTVIKETIIEDVIEYSGELVIEADDNVLR